MAKITKRRGGELQRGVCGILKDEPDGLHVKEIFKRLERLVPPNEYERGEYKQGRRYEFVVRFKTIELVKAGWLVKDRGQWSLTEEGRKAYEQIDCPEEFARQSSRIYYQWQKQQTESAEPEEAGDEEIGGESDADSVATLEEAEERAWSEVQEHLSGMNPYDFQGLVSGLIRAMGYYVEHQAPPGPDGGVDIVAHTDPLGIHGPRIKVQVKRRADRLNVGEVRAFMAVLSDGDIGLFVSTGGFTKDAASEARAQQTRRIMLLDLKRLFDLWVQHYDRIPESARRLLPLRAVHYLDPND